MRNESSPPSGGAVETIFNAALNFEGSERAAYLAGACGENKQLRQRVEALLQAQDEADAIREQEPARPSTRLNTMLEGERTTTAKHHQTDAPKLVHLLRGDLDWIVMKALEKDRTRRYETANGLAADIGRFLGNEPVIARPPSAAYRFKKMVHRNKLAFAAVGLVIGAVAAGAVISTWQAIRATQAQTAALRQRSAAEAAQVSEKEQRLIAQQKQAEAETQRHRAEIGESNAVRQLYIDKMNLAQAAWNENHVSRVRELLDETATAPERGFEWYYLQRQMHLALKTLRGHLDTILAVAYSPDGKRIITGGADKIAKVWEVATGGIASPARTQ